MKYLSLSFLILLLSIVSCSNTETESIITVQGSATVKVPVDFLKFRVTLQKEGTELEALVEESYETMLELKHIFLQEWNFPDSLVQTDESSIRRYFDRNSSEDFYRFSQTMTARLDSLELFETLRRDLINAGANEFEIISFGSNAEQEYNEKAIQKAYRNALEKAQVLATSADLTIGETKSISTSRVINLDMDFNLAIRGVSTIEDEVLESTLIKEYKELEADVNVQFYLE